MLADFFLATSVIFFFFFLFFVFVGVEAGTWFPVEIEKYKTELDRLNRERSSIGFFLFIFRRYVLLAIFYRWDLIFRFILVIAVTSLIMSVLVR